MIEPMAIENISSMSENPRWRGRGAHGMRVWKSSFWRFAAGEAAGYSREMRARSIGVAPAGVGVVAELIAAM